MTEQTPDAKCAETLSLIEPEADYPETLRCEKRLGHQSHHGDINGYAWLTMVRAAQADEPAACGVFSPQTKVACHLSAGHAVWHEAFTQDGARTRYPDPSAAQADETTTSRCHCAAGRYSHPGRDCTAAEVAALRAAQPGREQVADVLSGWPIGSGYGIPFDGRGTCRHCDVVRQCPNDCAHCRWRDHHCPVCGVRCPTIPARINHENKCREQEEARERKGL